MDKSDERSYGLVWSWKYLRPGFCAETSMNWEVSHMDNKENYSSQMPRQGFKFFLFKD